MGHHKHYFYSKPIIRSAEQNYIQELLSKYRDDPVNEELKKKIWDELQMQKYLGKITIPFKVILRRDLQGLFPDYIEVVLDTKV